MRSLDVSDGCVVGFCNRYLDITYSAKVRYYNGIETGIYECSVAMVTCVKIPWCVNMVNNLYSAMK